MTTKTQFKYPYHFDMVGSLLRTDALKTAHEQYDQQLITEDELKQVQRIETKKIVDKQVALGFKDVTDGEFNRNWWHLDFWKSLTGISQEFKTTVSFKGGGNKLHSAQLEGKVAYNPDHPFFETFQYLNSITPDGIIAKQTIPSPTLLFGTNWRDFYDDWDEYLNDLAEAYHDTILHFYQLGARYVQLDDTNWAFLISQLNATKDNPIEHQKYEQQAADAVRLINHILKDLPEDLTMTTHVCRGNFHSTYVFSGGYDVVADYLGQLNYDGLFLEYDSDRAGNFDPLGRIWNGDQNKRLVLGLVTSKSPELENKSELINRINQAAEKVPLENLALSTQCGFASSTVGNKLTQEQQWEKLRLVRDTAEDIWKD